MNSVRVASREQPNARFMYSRIRLRKSVCVVDVSSSSMFILCGLRDVKQHRSLRKNDCTYDEIEEER